MPKVTIQVERTLWKKGFLKVAGVDESGRGPLAGPVVASAVFLNYLYISSLPKLKSSKKINFKEREKIFKILTSHPAIEWGIGEVSPQLIDKINIFQASKIAMKKAVENLQKKLQDKIDYLIIDGNFSIDVPISQKSIIKADEKVYCCVCAGIIAKVYRDKLMLFYHRKYPYYRFDLHKGYPTLLHKKKLKEFGRCEIHRESFLKFLK